MADKEKGMSGLNWSGGTVIEERLTQLQGRQGMQVYAEMQNDPVVSAMLHAITQLVRQVEWRAEPHADGSDEDAEFIDECIEDMSHSFNDFISEVMSMVIYGWSFFEIVYKQRVGGAGDSATKKVVEKVAGAKVPESKYDDGKIGWRKFGFRSQDSLDTWEFDDDGGMRAMVQMPPPRYEKITIPIEKAILFRTTTFKNNPEGRSLLRAAYRPWFFKKRIEEIEGVGVERDLAGLPFAKVPPEILASDASQEEKAILTSIQNIIKNVRQDKEAGIIWPQAFDDQNNPLYEFTLLNSGGSRTFDTSGIIERYDRRITMTMLADFIMLGHEKVGSFALSSDKTNLFAVSLGALLDTIQETINRFAVPRLWAMNGNDMGVIPRIVHGDIEKQDPERLSTVLGKLAAVGMPLFPDEKLEEFIRDAVNIPQASDEAKADFEAMQAKELAGLEAKSQGQQAEEEPPPAEAGEEDVEPVEE